MKKKKKKKEEEEDDEEEEKSNNVKKTGHKMIVVWRVACLDSRQSCFKSGTLSRAVAHNWHG